MRLPTADEWTAMVAEAARAPSVHNVQPARWGFPEGGRVVLFRAVGRSLPVADPGGHDVRVSLGAAWEGMAIALSRRGWTLSEPVAAAGDVPDAPGCDAVLEGWIGEGAAEDDLAPCVDARRSWRGRFAATSEADVARLRDAAGEDGTVVSGDAALRAVARAYDGAAWSFVREPAYQAELWRWMRFSPAHPDWGRDGLNAECMALSGVERRMGSLLMRPRVFQPLRRVGVAKALVSEAAQTRSAGAVLLFTPPRAADDYAVGRLFYRLWLRVARAGLGAVPMSALSDQPEARARIEREHGVPAGRRLANVLRVGRVPGEAPRSPRLPVGEVLV